MEGVTAYFAGQWDSLYNDGDYRTLIQPKKLYELEGKYICLQRAVDWNFYTIQKWQASTCGEEETMCGAGDYAYCVDQKIFAANGNVCPIQKIEVKAMVPGELEDQDHVKWDDDRTLVLSRNDESYPMTAAKVSLKAPCWDQSENYAPERDDIDWSFKFKANTCESSFKGEMSDQDFQSTGLEINEYEILDDAGLIKELKKNTEKLIIGSTYKADNHKKYEYTLWEKDYTYWNPKCTKDGINPEKLKVITS